jgi:hypothetical protein
MSDIALSDQPYSVAHRDHSDLGMFLSEPVVTRLKNRPAIMMSRRLQERDGSFNGIVRATVDLEDFQRLYQAIDLGAGSAMNLLRDDGTLVVRQPPATQAVGGTFPSSSRPMRKPPASYTVPSIRSHGLWAWPTLPSSHWSSRTLILMLLGTLAIAALVYQLRRVGQGEHALRQSEERYALAMEGANEGHFDWNFGHEPAFLSRQMKLLHGRSADARHYPRSMDGRDRHSPR